MIISTANAGGIHGLPRLPVLGLETVCLERPVLMWLIGSSGLSSTFYLLPVNLHVSISPQGVA